MDGSSAQSLYRAEKARALQERRISHTQLMAEAKEAFAKMLADAQLARKGGRPRTNPVVVGAAAKPAVAAGKTPASAVKGTAGKKPAKVATKHAPSAKHGKVRVAAKRAASHVKAAAKKPASRAVRSSPRRKAAGKKR